LNPIDFSLSGKDPLFFPNKVCEPTWEVLVEEMRSHARMSRVIAKDPRLMQHISVDSDSPCLELFEDPVQSEFVWSFFAHGCSSRFPDSVRLILARKM
jgi:hypothetical protein